jgi:hypothetical protein
MRPVQRWLAALALVAPGFGACSSDDPVRVEPRDPRVLSVSPDGKGEYPTIQAAIDASINGDTISLENGRYDGPGNLNLDFGGRAIVLRSLSGNPIYCVIGSGSLTPEEYRGFHFHSGEPSTAVVEGITIEHGEIIGGGGAVLCEGSSPTFRNVVIESNGNTAVLVSGAASPTFVVCVFQRNDGAFSCRGGSAHFVGCTFRWNYSDGSGAAVGVYYASVVLQDCVFLGNGAGFGGAAIEGWSTSEAGRATVSASRCLFLDNTGSYHGGALYLMGTDFEITDCTFAGNQCGMNGGAFWCSYESGGVIRGSVFHGNSGTKGAAINVAGGAQLSIDDSIIAFNTGSEAIRCDTLFAPVEAAIQCSDIYGNAGGDWTDCIAGLLNQAGNTSVDPMFCDPSTYDFRLHPESPLLGGDCGPAGGWPPGCTPVAPAIRLTVSTPTAPARPR